MITACLLSAKSFNARQKRRSMFRYGCVCVCVCVCVRVRACVWVSATGVGEGPWVWGRKVGSWWCRCVCVCAEGAVTQTVGQVDRAWVRNLNPSPVPIPDVSGRPAPGRRCRWHCRGWRCGDSTAEGDADGDGMPWRYEAALWQCEGLLRRCMALLLRYEAVLCRDATAPAA